MQITLTENKKIIDYQDLGWTLYIDEITLYLLNRRNDKSIEWSTELTTKGEQERLLLKKDRFDRGVK